MKSLAVYARHRYQDVTQMITGLYGRQNKSKFVHRYQRVHNGAEYGEYLVARHFAALSLQILFERNSESLAVYARHRYQDVTQMITGLYGRKSSGTSATAE